MNINENLTMNANITVKDSNGNDVVVMVANATLDKTTQNLNRNISVVNQPLIADNAASIKQQYEEFEAAVKARAVELGYVIFMGGNA